MRGLVVALGWALVLGLAVAGCEREPRPKPATSESEPVPSSSSASGTHCGAMTALGLQHVEVVKGGAATDPLPMVVALHGLGDSAPEFAKLFDAFDGPARIIVMQAPTSHGGGYSWFPTRKDASSVTVHADGIVAAAALVAADTAVLVQTRPTKGKPLVTGFSQGGMLSFALALRHADLYERAVPLAGWLPEAMWPTARPANAIPIVALHGDADAMLPVGPTRDGVAHLKKLGFDVELRVFPGVPHTVSREMRRDLWGLLTR